ncbi:MAG TPA: DUF4388 domain-containing protein [Gemmatimonadaceae bacterium]|nr:DUF4388 domain-containing protein [Gemmatimonadaceae bacterium]
MAIEGPLRELGIHDVFQLLDLSRKTGRLRVTSLLRDNEGAVYFDSGRVVAAIIRSNPHPLGTLLMRAGKVAEGDLARARAMQAGDPQPRRLGEILVSIGALTPKELERQVRLQVEAVIFELMSWREGHFSFTEGRLGEIPADALTSISTESLLMEGARRIDEWARIEHKIPNLDMIPALAAIDEDHPSLLDLLPHEWEVLSLIDGRGDLRTIATALGTSDFDVARIAYGLLSTGVIELKEPVREEAPDSAELADNDNLLDAARQALREKRLADALRLATRSVAAEPRSLESRLLLARVLVEERRDSEADEELRRAQEIDPSSALPLLERGRFAARRGALRDAVDAWQRYLALHANTNGESDRVRDAADLANRLEKVLEELADV